MPSHHDWGLDCETWCGGTPDDDREPRNTLPDDACPTCGQRGCVGYCEEDDRDPMSDPDMAYLFAPPGPYYCTICGVNTVDPLHGEDTCNECLRKQ